MKKLLAVTVTIAAIALGHEVAAHVSHLRMMFSARIKSLP